MLFQTAINAPRQKSQAIVKQAAARVGIDIELKSIVPAVYFSTDPANLDTSSTSPPISRCTASIAARRDPQRFDGRLRVVGSLAREENKWPGRNTTPLAQRGVRPAFQGRRDGDGSGQARGPVHPDERPAHSARRDRATFSGAATRRRSRTGSTAPRSAAGTRTAGTSPTGTRPPRTEATPMKLSTDRILTTHTGSLPAGSGPDDARSRRSTPAPCPIRRRFEARVRRAVGDIVRQQVDAGVDIVNDGEQGKVGYSTYVRHRLTGFDGQAAVPMRRRLGRLPRGGRAASGARRSCGRSCNGADRVEGPDGGAEGRRQLQAAAQLGQAGRRVHDGGLARRHRALPQERALPEPGCVSGAPRRRHEGRVRRDPPAPGSCCRSTAPTWRWGGTSRSTS